MSADAGDKSGETPANTIRETIKWVIAAFAAPLAIMVGTSPLANFGALEGNRLAVAILCGGVGVGMILWAIKEASDVLLLDTYYLSQVRSEQSEYVDAHADDLLPFGYHSLEEFLFERKQRRGELADTEDEKEKEKLRAQLDKMQTFVMRIITVSHYERMREDFKHRRARLLTAAVIGTVAFGGFAWATGAPVKTDAKPPVSVYCGAR
ncbi:hypothetical protein [Rhizomicrobium electricum]|uniref:SMODS and SLOG-associating 2TM effector domain-containing protein n=1 Tax=Rhizomicrobium electricum TaxID=480070 RepID=A0ABN1E0B5_9PROT|nr:hypothetical protein [Rhizomicrobium electricum]NIJ47292.1 hypothetical protein [Rhizomicrobium electricum]